MLKRGFEKILDDPSRIKEDLPYVAALSFDELEEEESGKGAFLKEDFLPEFCKYCGSILVNLSNVYRRRDGFFWKCEYCGNENRVENPDVIGRLEKDLGKTSAEYLSIIFGEIRKDKTENKEIKKEGKTEQPKKTVKEAFISVIDISGSMYGGKLEAVKRKLMEIVGEMHKVYPDNVYILIAFSDYIHIYPTPDHFITVSEGAPMDSETVMEDYITRMLGNIKIGPVGEFGDRWLDKIAELQPDSYTALGPALYAAVILAEKKLKEEGWSGNIRIMLLTDGLANTGFGKVENRDPGSSRIFYRKLGERCADNGFVVDIIGVADENGAVALDVIGIITEITGGDMTFITRGEIDEAFDSLRRKRYIARNVIIRVYTPKGIEPDRIVGLYGYGGTDLKRDKPVKLGAVSGDREIHILFKQKGKIKARKIPIQIQIEYTDAENRRKYKVIRTEAEVTDNDKEFVKTYRADIYANMVAQQAAEAVKSGGTTAATKIIGNSINKLTRANINASNLNEAVQMLQMEQSELEEIERESEKFMDKGSFYASAAQKRVKTTFKSRMERLKKK